VDNGNQASHEPFRASRRKSFHGLCLAIIRSTEKSGTIFFKAESEGLEPATLTLKSK
jgi:beta-galactosidase